MTTSGTRFRSGFAPLMSGVAVTPFPSAYGWDSDTATRFAPRELDFLLQSACSPQDTAAVIVGPVLGEGGYVPATGEFLAGLRERADRHGFQLIMDDVQTGGGRTGRFWGHDHFGVTPDILITVKGLASGFPLSGIAASEAVMAKAWPGSQGGAYGGTAVACAAAVATLEVVHDEKLVENADLDGCRRWSEQTWSRPDLADAIDDGGPPRPTTPSPVHRHTRTRRDGSAPGAVSVSGQSTWRWLRRRSPNTRCPLPPRLHRPSAAQART
jgi:4-aminobutyrate aminotransferase-like enzyme